MLSVRTLSAGYGKIEVLHGVSLEVPNGGSVALVGANGAGKSTLVMAISGLVRPTRGEILFEGRHLSSYRPHEIVHLGVVQVPEGRKIFASLTVAENLLLAGSHNLAKPYRRQTLDEVFHLFTILRGRLNQPAGTLSGGEQQMLAIGRALMARPKLLMFDEPSLGLAPLIVQELFEIIERLNEKRITIFLIEQNVKQSLAVSHWAYVMENGNIILDGPGEEILRNEHIRHAYLGS